MHRRKYSPLVALPLIAIAFIAFGMTRSAFAASSSPSSASSVSRQSSAIERMRQRAANRSVTRRRVPVTSTLRPAAGRSSSSSSRTSASRSSSAAATSSIENIRTEIIRLVNEERVKAGLSEMTHNSILEQSAQEYAEHMRTESCFSHTECGSTLKERMHDSGYYKANGRSYYYGENIARGQDSAAEVMEDWMNSPSHRAAILSETFDEIGIGKSGTYWVQHFGAIR